MYKRFFALLLPSLLLTTGCSFFEAEKARSLPLQEYARADSVEELQQSPYLYRLQFQEETLPSLYVTLLEECSLADTLGERATTRQLFIGLKDLAILEQTRITLKGQSVVRSLAEARLEDVPLAMITYSFRNQDCVRDYVSWIPNAEATAIQPELVEALYTKLEQFLLSKAPGV